MIVVPEALRNILADINLPSIASIRGNAVLSSVAAVVGLAGLVAIGWAGVFLWTNVPVWIATVIGIFGSCFGYVCEMVGSLGTAIVGASSSCFEYVCDTASSWGAAIAGTSIYVFGFLWSNAVVATIVGSIALFLFVHFWTPDTTAEVLFSMAAKFKDDISKTDPSLLHFYLAFEVAFFLFSALMLGLSGYCDLIRAVDSILFSAGILLFGPKVVRYFYSTAEN